MELIRIKWNDFSKIQDEIVATIGQFDGIHTAHRMLIERTISESKQKGWKSAIFTFDPHPDFILKKDVSFTYVTPFHEKVELLRQLGLDYMVVIDFNLTVARMSPKDFVEKILLANHVNEVIIGYDFRFGCKGEGCPNDISLYSNNLINVLIMDEQAYQNQKIGTTLIKKLLQKGDMETVKSLLGRYYAIEGKVIHGNQVGRTLHFPTANLKVEQDFAKLLSGVYVVYVYLENKKYLGVANFGRNPSFNERESMVFETHILDFDGDIYGKHIRVELVYFIRSEIKFPSKEAFVKQLEQDIAFARRFG
ncbi:MAG: bifunctional riboflavin kinase/FAD synthetase [Prevotella sp.]|nr:bifunctional riboflavin kinase/FAD synthetase [Staphylococcus sp.]MCM1349722.1 bifunctional riboflavin kinase/FAD synthetase [Prevotella sp.]